MFMDICADTAKAPWINLPEPTDEALVVAAKGGDRAAFDALVARHERKVFFAALRITRNREDAEDVVQQGFHKAFMNLQRFEERASFSTWLTRIVFNEALMLKRSSHRSREISLDEPRGTERKNAVLEIADFAPSPESAFSQHERSRLLLSAMSDLKPGLRAAIEISDLDEKSARETAEVLDLSITAVKSRICRGRKALRDSLKRHMTPMGPKRSLTRKRNSTRVAPLSVGLSQRANRQRRTVSGFSMSRPAPEFRISRTASAS